MNIVVAITGASGSVFAARLLDVLSCSDHEVHLTMSDSARLVLQEELAISVNDLRTFQPEDFLRKSRQVLTDRFRYKLDHDERKQSAWNLHYHHISDFMAPIASGSFLTDGMVVCPCSGGTLASIVHGVGNNLIHRAADVHLKEHRPLVLVPRETPLSALQLENMHRVANNGAIVLPAMPGWYHGVHDLSDLIDFMIARILDQLHIKHQLMRRWGS